MSTTGPTERPHETQPKLSWVRRWAPRAGVLALLLIALGLGLSRIQSQEFLALTPIMPTTAKGLIEARSSNGLDFEVVNGVLGRGMASQAHRFREDKTLEIVATDPTILHTRRDPDGNRLFYTSSLIMRHPDSDQGEVLWLESCANPPTRRRAPTVQCVDPNIVRLPNGLNRMFFVRSVDQIDPAFSDVKNEFRSALWTDQDGWVEEEGVRFTAASAADPDVVRLADGRWRMYYTQGLVLDEETNNLAPGILSAISSDGLQFEAEDGVRIQRCSASATLVLASGQLRVFCHTREVFTHKAELDNPAAVIVSYRSVNGLDFEREPGLRVDGTPTKWGRFIGAAAPSLQPHPDGGVSMVFSTVIEPPFPWNFIYLRDNEELVTRIKADLAGRAKMGSADQTDTKTP